MGPWKTALLNGLPSLKKGNENNNIIDNANYHLLLTSLVFLLNVSTKFIRLVAVCSLITASLLQKFTDYKKYVYN